MEGHRELFGIPVDDGKKILLVNESQECIKKATGVPAQIIHEMNQVNQPVDEFLVEALQNPRHRLTILRLEQEILKFRCNTQLQQLQFLPMSSSFARLATHRVAQHYYMRTAVVEDGSGCRIVVWKMPETERPVVRLADMFPEVAQEFKPKVAIKQRPTPAVFGESGDSMKGGSKQDSTRSVEERKEEYNKARARIFREELDDDSVRVCHIEVIQLEDQSSKVNDTSPASKSDKENMSRGNRDPSTSTGSNATAISATSATTNSANSNTVKPKVNTKNRVAIFRDREKDSKDPDYDRSYDRYHHRREVSVFPGYNMQFDQPSWMPHPVYDRFPAQQWIYPTQAQATPRFVQSPRYPPASYVHSRH